MPLAEITYSTYPHGLPLFASGRRLVNYFAERAEGQASAQLALIGAPGMKPFSDLTTVADTAGNECRGFHWYNSSTLFTVVGPHFCSVASDGTPALISSSIAGTGPVTMVSDNDQMLIITAPGTGDYLWDSTGLSQLTGENIVDWRDAAILDGYAVLVQNTPDVAGRFSWTEVRQLATVGAANFANAESSPDALLRIMRVGRILWLLGESTVEPWYSDGATPFARYADAMHGIGIGAENSRAVLPAAAQGGEDRGFFLGVSQKSRPAIYMVRGGEMVRVSTSAIEEVLESGTYSDARGFAYSQRGHDFYNLTLPSLGRCFTFDAAMPISPTPFWHERQSGTALVAGWDARQCIVAHDKVLVGHVNDGKIYELDFDTHTDASANRLAMGSVRIPSSGEFRNRLDKVLFKMDVGVGAVGDEAAGNPEPQMVIDLSLDGGKKWVELDSVGIGYAGDYERLAEIRGLGGFINADLRFRITDPVERGVVSVFASGAAGLAA